MGVTPTRLPVGSWIVIGPPAVGTTALMCDVLTAAGLPANRFISRERLRPRFGNQCSALGCRMVPAGCRHHEDEVTALVEAATSTFLAAGRSCVLADPATSADELRAHVERAHRAGLAAVALRRIDVSTGADITLQQCVAHNATLTRRTPAATLVAAHEAYVNLDRDELLSYGFDVVLEWDANSRFELLPETEDARGLSTQDIVVVGDLHGCAGTFFDRMLPALGTDALLSNDDVLVVSVGDIHDKGDPEGSVALIRWWLTALRTGRALMVDSNHNRSLVRYLSGTPMRVSPSLAETVAAIDAQPDAEQLKADIIATFSRLPSHLWFDDLVVAHAGLRVDMLGDPSNATRRFAMYADNTRKAWEWTGSQTLVHGHDTVTEPTTRRAHAQAGDVINVDTGAHCHGVLSAYVHATHTCTQVNVLPHEVTGHAPSVHDPVADLAA